MVCNVGGIERPIRIGLGVLLVLVGLMAGVSPAVTWTMLILGGVALVSGLMGFCPAWTLLGINTCPTVPVKKS